MKKILIADDHGLIRAGLKQILSESPSFRVYEASNGAQALKMIKEFAVDALVLDISMPGKGGLEVLKEVKIQYPKVAVIMLSVYPEDQYAMRAIKAGASGYLTKDSAPENLVEALNKVLTGGKYITPFLAERLISQLNEKPSDTLHGNLSDREFEVLKYIGYGKTISEIGEKLCLSVKTISTYRSRILAKMKMRNNAELMQYVIKNEL